MPANYVVHDPSEIFSPALLFYPDLIQHNLDLCLKMAGSPQKLRPHCKTHKTMEIVRMALAMGITKHKCATLAEAEMLAGCGAKDILLAYPMVGPNCLRMVRLMAAFPDCLFISLIDHPSAARQLSAAMKKAGLNASVLLDVDVGQHRTGISPGDEALALYALLDELPGLNPVGLHVYDGHMHQSDPGERELGVNSQIEKVLSLRNNLEQKGLPATIIVAGGTPTFPIYARKDIPGLECSPGTCILHDHGYGSRFPDLAGFIPAAVLFTRVISKPTPTRLTLDLGYKAVASDPPAGKRLHFPDLENYEAVLQNEEHLVLETSQPVNYQPGDALYAIPTHICPTSALHQQAYVIKDAKLVGTWKIASRDRILSI